MKFFGHSLLRNLAIIMIMSCAYLVLVESNLCKIVAEFSLIIIISNVADSIDCVSIVPAPSEIKIALWLASILKKR